MTRQRMWQRGPDGEITRSAPVEAPASPGAADAPEVRKRTKLGLALRLGLRDTYDYLGTVLLMSVLWSLCSAAGALGGQAAGLALFSRLPGALPLFLTGLAALAGLTLVGGPLLAGLCRFARNAAARREPEVFDLAWGFREALGRSLGLSAVLLLGTVVLAANCYFYASQKRPLLVPLAAAFGYALLFWSLVSLYAWPLLAEQEIGPFRVLKKSALLVLDNFGYTLVLAALVAIASAALWVTMIGGALLWAGAVAMLLTQATRELLRKYHVLPPDPTLDPIAGETAD